MRIPRFHVVELEDQPWFPAVIRDLATDYLHFAEGQLRLHQPMAEPLAKALRETRSHRVIDLCSGGSGPVVALSKDMADRGLDLQFILSDRFQPAGIPARKDRVERPHRFHGRASRRARGADGFDRLSHDVQRVPPFSA